LIFPEKLHVAVVGGATQPGDKTMLSPVVCPNGPRFYQREITRMMSLMAQSGQSNGACVCPVALAFVRYWTKANKGGF
jgi:hypothetical protein